MRVAILTVLGAAGWLLCGGCGLWVQPEIPSEITAVLASPEFAETAEVTHKGSLDDLEGCWGSYTASGRSTDVVFHRFDSGEYVNVTFVSDAVLGMLDIVYRDEGNYEVTGTDTISITFTKMLVSDPETGLLTDVEDLIGETEGETEGETGVPSSYEVALDGDSMTIHQPDVDAPQYEGTFWRFAECP